MTNNTTIPKRRWLRFSLRTLLVFMCVACALFAFLSNSARRQRQIVKWVEQHGGTVWYKEDENKSLAVIWEIDPPYEPQTTRSWLSWLGKDYESSVVGVNLTDTDVQDLTPLAGLKDLKYLYLDDSKVSDLTPIGKLENLIELSLHGTSVSDIQPLGTLTNLRALCLTETKVSVLRPLEQIKHFLYLRVDEGEPLNSEVVELKRRLPHLNTSIFDWITRKGYYY